MLVDKTASSYDDDIRRRRGLHAASVRR